MVRVYGNRVSHLSMSHVHVRSQKMNPRISHLESLIDNEWTQIQANNIDTNRRTGPPKRNWRNCSLAFWIYNNRLFKGPFYVAIIRG